MTDPRAVLAELVRLDDLRNKSAQFRREADKQRGTERQQSLETAAAMAHLYSDPVVMVRTRALRSLLTCRTALSQQPSAEQNKSWTCRHCSMFRGAGEHWACIKRAVRGQFGGECEP